ncbi:MAG TPA: hypothetical protein VGT05_05255 [Patescibacteria group bacterium]|nr:hypothetical protein [Patescibacteria group bacterium]
MKEIQVPIHPNTLVSVTLPDGNKAHLTALDPTRDVMPDIIQIHESGHAVAAGDIIVASSEGYNSQDYDPCCSWRWCSC